MPLEDIGLKLVGNESEYVAVGYQDSHLSIQVSVIGPFRSIEDAEHWVVEYGEYYPLLVWHFRKVHLPTVPLPT